MVEATATATPMQAPEAEKYPDGSPIKKGAQSSQFWPTQQKAEEIARSRTKGARRAFIVKDPHGTTRYATATHIHYLFEYLINTELGWSVDEVGKLSTSRVPATPDAIMAAINAMPNEKEREAIKKQLELLLKKK